MGINLNETILIFIFFYYSSYPTRESGYYGVDPWFPA